MLLKEKNALLTERLSASLESKVMPKRKRILLVERSMSNVMTVVKERSKEHKEEVKRTKKEGIKAAIAKSE